MTRHARRHQARGAHVCMQWCCGTPQTSSAWHPFPSPSPSPAAQVPLSRRAKTPSPPCRQLCLPCRAIHSRLQHWPAAHTATTHGGTRMQDPPPSACPSTLFYPELRLYAGAICCKLCCTLPTPTQARHVARAAPATTIPARNRLQDAACCGTACLNRQARGRIRPLAWLSPIWTY